MPDVRYGIYYAPPQGSALARFGASWLGRDAEAGLVVPHPEVACDVARITATPRKYGFHGTLKPPFRLAEGQSEEALRAAIADLASGIAAFEAPPLELRRIGRFLAMVPSKPSQPLADLAGACVEGLDAFRAPPTPEETAKRQAAGLTPRQEHLLLRWGYPYVFDEFRFHLTLTGALDADEVATVADCLAPLTDPFRCDPMPVHEICLFQQIDGAPFRILHRYPLTG